MKSAFMIVAVLLSCTDYELKNVEESSSGGDEAGSEGGTNGEHDSDNTEETETTEDPNNESQEEEEECSESSIHFDIEDVSTLQDAVSYSVAGWSQDAVVLNFNDSALAANQKWRVSAVEILVLISEAHFPNFVDGQEIHIQVFDANNPNTTSFWTMTGEIIRSEHNWSEYTLPNDAWYAGTYAEYQQKGVWLRFDTRTVISSMTSSDFMVGVLWEPPGMVKLGYSNFNQDCEQNWSNYGSGWGLNSENPDFFGCSWPMMRIEIEVITVGDCE